MEVGLVVEEVLVGVPVEVLEEDLVVEVVLVEVQVRMERYRDC